MNKQQLIDNVANQQGLTKNQAKAIVESVFENIKKGVSQNGKAQFVGFGTFSKVSRKAREGRNPATGTPVQIPAKEVVKFKPYF